MFAWQCALMKKKNEEKIKMEKTKKPYLRDIFFSLALSVITTLLSPFGIERNPIPLALSATINSKQDRPPLHLVSEDSISSKP